MPHAEVEAELQAEAAQLIEERLAWGVARSVPLLGPVG